jgi:hypothetical protein
MKIDFSLFSDLTVEEAVTISGGGGHAPQQPAPCNNPPTPPTPPTPPQPPFIILFPGILTQRIG